MSKLGPIGELRVTTELNALRGEYQYASGKVGKQAATKTMLQRLRQSVTQLKTTAATNPDSAYKLEAAKRMIRELS